jgi:hypothetical protein
MPDRFGPSLKGYPEAAIGAAIFIDIIWAFLYTASQFFLIQLSLGISCARAESSEESCAERTDAKLSYFVIFLD